MASANLEEVSAALQAQGQRIHLQEEQLSAVRREMRGISKRQESLFSSMVEQLQVFFHEVQRIQHTRC